MIRHVPEHRAPVAVALALVTGSAAVATAVGWLAGPWLDPSIRLAPYVPAVFIASLWGGRAAGAAAVALTAALAWTLFVARSGGLAGAGTLVLIVSTGILTLISADALRLTISALRRRESELLVSEERLSDLVRELDHRIKNLLTVASTLSEQTARNSTDVESYRKGFAERLGALGRAQTALLHPDHRATSLGELAVRVLEPFAGRGVIEFVGGEEILVGRELCTPLGLALHELATNAAKYGALARPGGRVVCAWSRLPEGSARLSWTETGVGPVPPTSRRGFGATLLTRILSRYGRPELGYGDDGLSFNFTFTGAPRP